MTIPHTNSRGHIITDNQIRLYVSYIVRNMRDMVSLEKFFTSKSGKTNVSLTHLSEDEGDQQEGRPVLGGPARRVLGPARDGHDEALGRINDTDENGGNSQATNDFKSIPADNSCQFIYRTDINDDESHDDEIEESNVGKRT